MHQQGTEQGHHQGNDQGQGHASSHAALHALRIPGAEALGRDHGEACGDPLGKTRDQEHDGTGGAHRRQCIAPHIAAYDDGIRHVVKLLEYIARKKGQHKTKHYGDGTSLCHIKLHAGSEPFFIC